MKHGQLAGVALAVGAAMLALAGCASPTPSTDGSSTEASSDETPRVYKLATYVAPTAPHGKTLVWLADEVSKRTNGVVTIETYFNGELLPADELLSGVVDGRADFVFMTQQYNPAELPLSQITSIPFVTTDMSALSSALDYLAENSEAYQEEWESAGVVPLAFTAAAPSLFATKEPAPGVDWIQGRSIRAAGQAATAVQAAGGNAVSLVVGEIYESIQRGLLDGYTSMILDAVPSLSLEEVAPYIADTGLGTYSFNAIVANAATWDSMPEADRTLIAELAAEFDGRYRDAVTIGEDEACDAILAAGGEVTVWPDREIDKWKQLVGDAPREAWQSAAEAAGAPAEAFYDEYMEAIDAASGDSVPSGMARCAER